MLPSLEAYLPRGQPSALPFPPSGSSPRSLSCAGPTLPWGAPGGRSWCGFQLQDVPF